MLKYAVGLTYFNNAKNPVGYIIKIFSEWKQNNIHSLEDLKVNLCDKEKIDELLINYQLEAPQPNYKYPLRLLAGCVEYKTIFQKLRAGLVLMGDINEDIFTGRKHLNKYV